MGVSEGAAVELPLGVDTTVESRDDGIETGGIARRELLAEVPIGNTGTCERDTAGMLNETPV